MTASLPPALKSIIHFFTQPKNTWIVGLGLLFIEIFINAFIIWKVKYTEIDWEAYMDEVKGAIDGERDYMQLGGATGPLVYPAGFVYIFGFFYYITGRGLNIFHAQLLFAGLYLINLAVVFLIYHKSKSIPPYVLLWMTFTSYRIHSIFVLRLFNDPVAMLLFYISVLFFMNLNWTIGCLFYSLAISVKMNILLFAPAVLFLLVKHKGPWIALTKVLFCVGIQIIIGLPFLLSHPASYLGRAFEFSRQFFFKWTVNWRFVGEEVFLDSRFQTLLLVLHLGFILFFGLWKWTQPEKGLKPFFLKCVSQLIKPFQQFNTPPSSPSWIAFVLFSSNFIGMAFSRSLHYQFYIWYYHTLPFLLWHTPIPVLARFVILAAIEFCWNVYPSTNFSSILLLICHQVLLVGLVFSKHQSHFTTSVVSTPSSEKKSG